MGAVVLKVVFLVLKVTALAAFLVFQASSVYSLSPAPSTSPVSSPGVNATVTTPSPASLPNGTFVEPPHLLPPLSSASAPQNVIDHIPSFPPNNSFPLPVYPNGTVPAMPPSPEASDAAPLASPSRISPQSPPTSPPFVSGSLPPKSDQSKAPEAPLMPTAPVSSAPEPKRMPQNPPSPRISPSIVPVGSSPGNSPGNLPPIPPALPEEPPSSSSEPNAAPAPPPQSSIRGKGAGMPVAAPPNGTSTQQSPVNPSPGKAPSAHEATGNSYNAPSPLPLRKAPVVSRFHSPASQPSSSFQRDYHGRNYNRTPAPAVYMAPASSIEAPPNNSRKYPKTDLKLHAPPPLNSGSSIPPSLFPFPSPKSHDSYSPSPHPASPSGQMPIHSPKMSPSESSPRMPKMPLHPPFQALPPPPPNEDCTSLTCSEPLTNGPPGSPCVCVLPMQVGLRLSVALYNFFPLVSEFAAEIASGVFLKLSQVRIMGANAASQDPEKTIVLTDLVPLGETFDNTTAYLTFRRFWLKEVVIQTSLFGDYEVLYVRYPGLPPSPPSAPSDIGIINADPYSSRSNNGAAVKPLGVDVRRQHQRGGLSGSVIAIIVLSASVVLILCCAIAWILVLKHREQLCQPDSTPPVTIPSLAKSSGIPTSMIGSGPSSLSYGSSIGAYAGSAKSFSSSDIEKATDNFSETRILGEGGFGRVYSGVLEDGTQVAVKILKRADQQGSREFLAEVEMLSRLHHRNLVKLIGICTEERTRCLIYELIPNGSVESHLHGVHKESSPLDWGARIKIALGAARGLAYLHEDSSPRVIHRDFKSSNILLEHDFTPKVSDFGLARTALDEENKHISTRVMGTFGYVAPEYAMTGHLLVKSDVYSYGVVLLELLTGRKPVDMSQPPGQENLVSWARPLLTSKEGIESIIDTTLGPDLPFDNISKVAAIASMCVQPEVSNRPFMGEVVQALKLICNECDETKETRSRSCSEGDLSLDVDARTNTTLEHLGVPLQGQSPVSNYDCDVDVERRLSVSDLLSSSTRYAMQDSGSLARHSGSGPLRMGKARRLWLWEKMRRLSGGTVSEHGLVFKSWHGSR
ncbi:hypothetical protein ACH5RR_004074 [Cinchona calisaya]|uniref:Protein kinase domain-containing protein n=1 Tax=Cinchona calisaya TaxID=153742 RepID=A0ABD3AWL3_9GENT